jgi:hypothetical protein
VTESSWFMLVLRIEPVADGSPSMAKELCVVSHAYLLKGRCVLLGNEDKGVVWLRIQVVDTSPAAAHKLQYNPEEQSTSTLHSSPICCIKKQKKSNNSTISSTWKLSHSHCLSSYFPWHWLFDHCTKETPCVLTLNLTEEAQRTMKLLHASAPKTK